MSDKNKKSGSARTPKARVKRRRPRMRTGYVCECQVCGNGLIRFWLYRGTVVGLCDECELVWSDVGALSANPSARAAGSYPGGPDREGKERDWKPATHRDVERARLDGMVAGYSE